MTTEDHSSLQHIEGYSFTVLFSAGTEARAKQVAALCERAHRYLRGMLRFAPTVRLLVLSPQDWETYADVPVYGLPHTVQEGQVLVMGDEPADFWQGVIRRVDDFLAPAQRAEMEAVYGLADGQINIVPFTDLIVVHELAHLFHEQVPFEFPRLWLDELFANLCVHTYIAEREPKQLPVWTTLPAQMMAVPTDRVRHRSLDDFEKLYADVGPENYVWYQFRLIVAAKSVYDNAGVDALRRLYRTFATRETELTDQQLAELLEERVHPAAAEVMQTWPE